MDYEGDDLQTDLKRLDELHAKIQQQVGGRLDGPYLPQDASVLYIYHADQYESLNKAGRLWFAETKKAKLPFITQTYEVCVTPKEFFGQQ